jgi:23S rRNA pseudouridine1911/1915/1917 synthase
MPPTQEIVVAAEDAGQRLDRFLAARLPGLSRSRIAELIDEGRVRVNGSVPKRARALRAGERIEVEAVPRPSLAAAPEDLPLEVLYQDDDVIVVNKPAGQVAHPAPGHRGGTLVNALLHHFGQLAQAGEPVRPGIVHRLDIGTSGALVVARNDAAHARLAVQFRARSVEKIYVVLVHGAVKLDAGTIELSIARDLRRRIRMMAVPRAAPRGARAARTDFKILARLEDFTLLGVALRTGRTHQIRVHFSSLGHPVVGDTLYGAPRRIRLGSQALPALGRNFLHAARISFEHPGQAGRRITVLAPLPAELLEFLAKLAAALRRNPEEVVRVIDAAHLGSLQF